MSEAITPKKKKKKKIWIPILLVILLLAGAAAAALRNAGVQMELISNTIEVEPAQYRDLSDSISIKGTISGESSTNVTSVASAEVVSVSVQPGDIVSCGDELVALDTAELEKSIASLNTDIANADALSQLEAAQRTDSLNQAVEDQATALTRAQNAVDDAQSQYDTLQKEYEECKEKLDQKNNSLGSAKDAVSDSEAALKKASSALEAAQTAYTLDPEGKKAKKAYESALSEQSSCQTAYENASTALATLEADIASLESQVSAYEDSLKTAQSAIDSANEAYSDTSTSTARAVSSAQSTIDMAKYQSSDSTLSDNLESLTKQLADCTLTAPCSGVVTAVNVSVGDNYAAGTTMITIEDTSTLKVVVSVEEADILKLEEGMKAVITTDATGEKEISGTVTRVVRVKNQSLTDSTTTGNYSAEITISDNSLLIGMTAKATIILAEKADVLAVPYDLIRYDESGNAYILTAEGNGDGTATAVRKNITLGEEVDYYTEVTGGDLKEGDMLIYDYDGTVSEGDVFSPEQLYSEQSIDSLTVTDVPNTEEEAAP